MLNLDDCTHIAPKGGFNSMIETNIAKELMKERLRLDKLVQKNANSRCPKCKKKMKTFNDIKEHAEEFHHFGDFDGNNRPFELRFDYSHRNYFEHEVKIFTQLNANKRFLENLRDIEDDVAIPSFTKLKNKIKDLQQAIRVLEER
jgi:hypothetical protein